MYRTNSFDILIGENFEVKISFLSNPTRFMPSNKHPHATWSLFHHKISSHQAIDQTNARTSGSFGSQAWPIPLYPCIVCFSSPRRLIQKFLEQFASNSSSHKQMVTQPLFVLSIGMIFEFRFRSNNKLQSSMVSWTLKTNNFIGSWKSQALEMPLMVTCFAYSSSLAIGTCTFLSNLRGFFLS